MRFTTFEQGFRAELANREFARIGMAATAIRTEKHETAPFWRAYDRLERFNAPRYRAAAQRLGISDSTGAGARLRGRLVGWMPNSLRRESIRFAFPRTVEYVEDLRRLAAIGPTSEADFFDYMLRQEELQVNMMEAMLRGRNVAAESLVDRFIGDEGR